MRCAAPPAGKPPVLTAMRPFTRVARTHKRYARFPPIPPLSPEGAHSPCQSGWCL